MAENFAQDSGAPRPARAGRFRVDPWSLGALLIAAVVLMPIVSVVWLAFNPTENIWPHLVSTTLPRYFSNTVILAGAVGAITAAVGTGTAWLVTMYDFPCRGFLARALLFPLAIPAYVGAYALVDFLEYAGPVQTGMRALFGWQSAREYWFPEIRSRLGAIVVLSAALFPYVFLLARAAFQEQSGGAHEVARALGAGPWRRFLRVGLPLARPAVAAGVAIVMMETVADFGTVDYFAVQTLTTGIFSVWLQSGNAGGAAQIASVMLGIILVLMALEKFSRRRSRFHEISRNARPISPIPLAGGAAWLATAACAFPFLLGFVLPGGVILWHALNNPGYWVDPGLARAFAHTLITGGAAAVICVLAALFMVYGVRQSGRRLPRLLLPLTTLGYAAPGAVLGVGILIPLARFDNWLADVILSVTGHDVGLILTGSAFAIVLAYVVRFFAIAEGATDAALERVAPNLPLAARSLGRTAGGALREIHVPLIRGSVATALLLVFVDCVKELPATLLLRPFNYNTLATRVHEKASLEQIGQAAPAALLVIAVGLLAVMLMARGR
ncbi:iron(III) transport system permease protein [Meinhardsimonia xiamenensis]|jgi:iron(III) transport system permease protein|uniref:Iron(III) transport system permease protein n=1 Tax=Meinhardsimonia xiamenensis TaxID=990712 RepID=A0A1G9BGY4_9RHOB|nr:iron ABC transporter permease [Meinhardsimonia xiamenensis]PRX34985.1 iron(III) transport system permease protein [Meinhardsimonia xiamenensis]SDK38733.1 iron(III) transport system permease protein [Meinhardsimonia xiamenensis]